MKYFPILLITFILAVFYSCKKDESFLKSPDVKLRFTMDTVMFDTVFTRLGSTTKRFLVHNDYSKSIKISSIKLAGGDQSPYRINIDGQATSELLDYSVMAGDSFYIFVDVTIDPNNQNLPFIVKDSILFETNGNIQDVKLVAFGQDAHYLVDSVMDYNATWPNDKPYVIYNSILITENKKLTIQPGVKIYSYGTSRIKNTSTGTYDIAKSKIYVFGTLDVQGTVSEPVIFQGVRLEQYYKDSPGQWGGIRLLPRSKNNSFKNTSIRNADIGVEVDSLPSNSNPNLVMENVKIENMNSACLLGYTSTIKAYNCLFDNSCQYLVVGDLGGTYEFYHCTFGHSTCNCSSHYPAFAFYNGDYKDTNGTVIKTNELNLTVRNSIIWGEANDLKKDEIELKKTGSGNVTIAIDHTILETTDQNFNINSNLINKDPRFKFPCKYNYRPDSISPALGAGLYLGATFSQLAFDMDGNLRSGSTVDLGAYERKH